MTDYAKYESNVEDVGASKVGVVLQVDGEEIVISSDDTLRKLKSAVDIAEGFRDGFD